MEQHKSYLRSLLASFVRLSLFICHHFCLHEHDKQQQQQQQQQQQTSFNHIFLKKRTK